jgi:serine/threonine-protein kinase
MTDADVLSDLLCAWEEQLDRGAEVPVEVLARDHPELIPQLRQRIEHLRRLRQLAAVPERVPSGPAPSWPATLLPSLPRIPGYEVLAELGRGGGGVVYRARDALNREVAIKMVLAGAAASAQELARFRLEAESVARLQHPHVVQVFNWGETNGQPFFVMEYVPGGSLARRLDGRPQPPGDAARLVLLLARAVQAAHERGIVHRDLKPGNVLLAPAGSEPALNSAWGQPKVSDFGLARRLEPGLALTAPESILGTPAYMAPEQAAGRPEQVGPATDVYALGVILYELLTGQVPFRGDSVLDTLDQVRHRPPQSPSQVCAGVPPELAAICLTCLRKEPTQRYPTALALAADLQRYLEGQAITPLVAKDATAPQPVPAGRKERRWRWVVAAGVVLALLAVGVALALWSGRRPAVGPPLKGLIDVRVWEGKSADRPFVAGNPQRQRLRLHEEGALPLRPGDWLRIEVTMERPAYLYVVWIDTEGKATPLYPWQGYDWEQRPQREERRARLSLPETADGIAPLGAGPAGVETLLLLAREEPLSEAENAALPELFAGLPKAKVADVGVAAWFENGELVSGEREPTRGAIRLEQAQAADDPVLRLQGLLRTKLKGVFGYSRAVCFGNVGAKR